MAEMTACLILMLSVTVVLFAAIEFLGYLILEFIRVHNFKKLMRKRKIMQDAKERAKKEAEQWKESL